MRRCRLLLLLSGSVVVLVCAFLRTAGAQCTLPNQLTNGQVADATQAMANFNGLVTCIGNTVTSGTAGQVGYYATTGNSISGESLSALIDSAIGSTQGDILYRDVSGWKVLPPGTASQYLQTQGAGANPQWAAGTGNSPMLYDLTPRLPRLSTFTQVNISGTTSVSENPLNASLSKGISIVDTGKNAIDLIGLFAAAPTPPYRLAVLVLFDAAVGPIAGPLWGFTDGTKEEDVVLDYANQQIYHETWTTSTNRASAGSFTTQFATGYYWLGLRDDNAGNVYFEISPDGANFRTLLAVAKSSGFLGSSGYSNLFVGLLNDSTSQTTGTILCWDRNGLNRVVGY